MIYLANEIAATFEGQSATSYYHPFCVENGTRMSATGKLLDHISYVKRLMRIDGILKDSKERRRLREAADISEQPISKIGLIIFIHFTESFIIWTHMPLNNYLFII